MNKLWKIVPKKYDDIILQLLYNRRVIDDKDNKDLLRRFFEPNFELDLFDPFLIYEMDKAAKRIKEAVLKGERIGLIADYDADGIPGGALLYRGFKRLGVELEVFIPNREDGYGLTKDNLDYLIKEKKCSLILTVDLGIKNIHEASYAKELGVDLIITDHHIPDDKEIPNALAVINPKISKGKYPDKDLCGCAVAYKLLFALSKHFPDKINTSFLKWNLDLVAVSTISDVVSLVGENRTLAKYGLLVLKKTRNLGLKALIEVSGIKAKEINSYHVGFQIGPRINAPGRLDHATKSLELLITEDENEARQLAMALNETNSQRQQEMDKTFFEVDKRLERSFIEKQKIIIEKGDWKKGVIGPVASRLVEKYNRPVILFAQEKDGLVGSARSLNDINIVEMLEKVKDLLIKFGGHKGAAGLAVLLTKYDKFIKNIIRVAEEIDDKELLKVIKIDAELNLLEITKKLYLQIQKFEPFGMGNPRPTFILKGVTFSNIRYVGKDKSHFSAILKDGSLKVIYFNYLKSYGIIRSDVKYDIVFNVGMDEWMGNEKLSLNLIDLRQLDEKK